MALTYNSARKCDLEILVAIRVAAMKESLENIGRFDPERARKRFAETFAPDKITKIIRGADTIGFYMLSPKEDHLWLDHFYIKPEFQGCGTGSKVMTRIIKQARELSLPLKLCALKESKANNFYKNHGFTVTHSEEWDNYYIRA